MKTNLIKAFSLIESLTVIAILTVLAALSGAAFRFVDESGAVNRAIYDLAGTLELARNTALSQNTYVRVAMAETGSVTNGSVVVCLFYSADGARSSDMSDAGSWRMLSTPLVLRSFKLNSGLCPGYANDQAQVPSETDIAPLPYRLESVGDISFTSFIQFSPYGNASVLAALPVRTIEMGVDKLPALGRNPFVVRISGTSGRAAILRKEDI